MTTTQDLDGTLRRVQALLAKALGTTNEHEAEAYNAKAEALMHKYRIDETMLSSQPGATSLKPVWRTVRGWTTGSGEFRTTYRFMLAQAMHHAGCRIVIHTGYEKDEEGNNWITSDCVGYDSDLRYAEMLFTSFSLAFAGKMQPKHNPALSDQENAYNMRSAGMEGWRIAEALWGTDEYGTVPKPNRVKARKLFAAEATKRGEDPSVLLGKGNSVSVYRESYAEGFQSEVNHRLRRMRQANDDSGSLVLASRPQAVTEALYLKYPDLKPGVPNPDNAIGGRDTCAKCKAAKSGYCRDHAYMKPSQAMGRQRSFNGAGYTRGVTAAQSVDLGGRAGTRVSSPSRSALGGG